MPAASTASMASFTEAGPTRMPAFRSVRAKKTMLSAMRPSGFATLGADWNFSMALLRRRELGLHFLQDATAFAFCDPRDVVLVFQEHAKRVGDGFRIQRHLVKFRQRARPIDGLGYARRLEQLDLAQLLDETDHLG